MRTNGHRLIPALALLVLSSCDADLRTGAGPDESVFVLQSIAGDAPPVSPFPTNNAEILTDTIILRSDGTGLRRGTERRKVDGAHFRSEESITWAGAGSEITIFAPCVSIEAGCTLRFIGMRGVVYDGRWIVQQSSQMRVPAIYHKVR